MSWAQSLLVPAAAAVCADFFAIDLYRKEVEQRTPLFRGSGGRVEEEGACVGGLTKLP